MADLTRPPAPFLPPEIVSQILHFIHPRPQDGSKDAATPVEFAVVSRINSSWTYQAQKRLYEKIRIDSSKQLKKLVTSILDSDGRLGLFIISLNLSYKSTNSRNAHQVFLLLTSIPNLQFLSFSNPQFDRFSSRDETALRATTYLPNLTSLLRLQANRLDWNREVFDPIIGTTSVTTLMELYLDSTFTYQGPLWSSIIPRSLKKLNLGLNSSILAGLLWPVAQFQGLEELNYSDLLNSNSIQPFFEVVGPSLTKLSSPGSSIPLGLLSFCTALEDLHVDNLGTDAAACLSQLPLTLKKLLFFEFPSILPPLDSWSHLINFESVTVQYLASEIDFSLLPRLKLLRIKTAYLDGLMGSMRSLAAGAIDVLELGREIYFRDAVFMELSENEKVRARCRELGITLNRLKSD